MTAPFVSITASASVRVTFRLRGSGIPERTTSRVLATPVVSRTCIATVSADTDTGEKRGRTIMNAIARKVVRKMS